MKSSDHGTTTNISKYITTYYLTKAFVMNIKDNHKQELKDLRKEVKTLRRYRQIVRVQGKGLSVVGGLSTSLFLGPKLTLVITQWLEAKKTQDDIPIEVTTNLMAALVRRFIRVGLFTATLALIPTALLLWQNLIMEKHHSALITQIEEQRLLAENQQITVYFSHLLSGERQEFWGAVSYFSSSESLTKEAVSRLSRMLLESEGKGACSSLEALARLSPQSTLNNDIFLSAPHNSHKVIYICNQ